MLKIVYMDIYDCRSEYDFYNRFAETIMKSTGNHLEQVMENIKRFLVRISPKISFSPEPNSEFSVSLGITPKDYSPEEILNLPERIAKEQGVRLVVCIDEFQQIGEFTDSLTIQKRLRGVWQHHQNVSYCFFGSKKHLMEIFSKIVVCLFISLGRCCISSVFLRNIGFPSSVPDSRSTARR